MKKPGTIITRLFGSLAFSFALLGFGLAGTQAQPTANPAFVSVDKTSFNHVTAQLDPGGDFFLYLGTAQWLEHLSAKMETWRVKMLANPSLTDEARTNVNNGFDTLEQVIQDSGLQDISGLGISSVKIENGLYRNKILLHHYPGRGDGFLWKLYGDKAHPLTGLDLLPTNTALAVFSDVNLPLVWSVAQKEVAQSHFPQAQDFMAKLPVQFEQQTQVKWDTFLNSLGGEFGIVLTLDLNNTVPLPLPSGMVAIPSPALMFVAKVNDDTIFNRLDTELKTRLQAAQMPIISTETNGVKMRTVFVPLPLAIELHPSVASGQGYLFIASSDAIIRQALAVQSGQVPGLKSTAEFKRLSRGIPDEGNQFTFMSESFGKTIAQIQKQTMAAKAPGQSPAQAEWIQSLFAGRPAYAYSVAQYTDTGCLTTGNGSQSGAAMLVLPAVFMGGMMGAIAIPNFVHARETAQRNACINNLRMIDAAKQQWALEKGKKEGDLPTQDDLMPYIGHWPVCPQGGTYTINPIGQAPTCSVHGHVLPQ